MKIRVNHKGRGVYSVQFLEQHPTTIWSFLKEDIDTLNSVINLYSLSQITSPGRFKLRFYSSDLKELKLVSVTYSLSYSFASENTFQDIFTSPYERFPSEDESYYRFILNYTLGLTRSALLDNRSNLIFLSANHLNKTTKQNRPGAFVSRFQKPISFLTNILSRLNFIFKRNQVFNTTNKLRSYLYKLYSFIKYALQQRTISVHKTQRIVFLEKVLQNKLFISFSSTLLDLKNKTLKTLSKQVFKPQAVFLKNKVLRLVAFVNQKIYVFFRLARILNTVVKTSKSLSVLFSLASQVFNTAHYTLSKFYKLSRFDKLINYITFLINSFFVLRVVSNYQIAAKTYIKKLEAFFLQPFKALAHKTLVNRISLFIKKAFARSAKTGVKSIFQSLIVTSKEKNALNLKTIAIKKRIDILRKQVELLKKTIFDKYASFSIYLSPQVLKTLLYTSRKITFVTKNIKTLNKQTFTEHILSMNYLKKELDFNVYYDSNIELGSDYFIMQTSVNMQFIKRFLEQYFSTNSFSIVPIRDQFPFANITHSNFSTYEVTGSGGSLRTDVDVLGIGVIDNYFFISFSSLFMNNIPPDVVRYFLLYNRNNYDKVFHLVPTLEILNSINDYSSISVPPFVIKISLGFL